jgi:hypothetical protein
MKKHEDSLDAQLDRAIEGIRDDAPDPATVDEAASRVWKRLGREMGSAGAAEAEVGSIRSCTDYQRLIPGYLNGELSEARKLLLEDHTRECIPCRRALHAARSERLSGGATIAAAPARRTSARSFPYRWAAAAVFLLVAVLAAWQFVTRESGGELRIASVDGTIYQVAQDGPSEVGRGTVLTGGERIRTAKDSGAVIELADGSRVEMNERSEIHVTERRDHATVNLARGSIIVEASDQGSGHLFVRTEDCLVSVTGTVFSVVHGNRGSRVSVIEGEVHVDYSDGPNVLRPGQQLRTSPFLGPISIAEEISWSRNLDEHLALLRELSEFQRELAELPTPGLRYSTELLDRAPEGTIIYIGLPNLSETLSEAHRLFRERVESSPVLQQWWEENVVATGAEPELAEAIEKVRLFGEQLGDEIVVTLQRGPGPEPVGPVLLAELERPGQFRKLLSEEMERLEGDTHDGRPPLRIIENPFAQVGADRDDDLLLFIQGKLLVAAPKIADLQHVASLAGTPGSSRFVGSSFHEALARTYRDGVSILFGADMEAILGHNAPRQETETLESLGLLDLRHLIVERHDADDRTVTRANLSFDETRKGVASWLAEPAPMGTLDFISADATAAGVFVVKTPASLLEELFSTIGKADQEFQAEMERLQSEHGIDLVADIAGPLGGEIAFALDGPVLPKPAWKLVMEVYDQPGLQRAVEWAVKQANTMASREDVGGVRLSLSEEQVRGRTSYTLSIGDGDVGVSIHYVFVDGYLVVAPERGLLDRSIQYRDSGYTLPTSPEFASALPEDGRAHFSAIVYHNLGPVLDPFLQSRIAQSAPLTPEQRKAVDDLARESRPSLFYAYAEPKRIVVGGSDHAGLLGTNLGDSFQLGSILGLQDALRHAAESQHSVYDGPDF